MASVNRSTTMAVGMSSYSVNSNTAYSPHPQTPDFATARAIGSLVSRSTFGLFNHRFGFRPIAQKHRDCFLAVRMHEHAFKQARQGRNNVRPGFEPLKYVQRLASRPRDDLRFQ